MDTGNFAKFYGQPAEILNNLRPTGVDDGAATSGNGCSIAASGVARSSMPVPFRKRKFDGASFSSDDATSVGVTDFQVSASTESTKHPKSQADDLEPEQSTVTQNKAEAMMAKMGFKRGRGLGKDQQGRADAIQVEMKLGRRGLGAGKTGLEPSLDVSWDHEKDEISVEEVIDWAPECSLIPLSEEDDTENWIRVDQRVSVIDNETEFMDPEILKDMLSAKSIFDELNDRDLRHARGKANPFESIKGAFFQNRAAMKMANLDAVLDFALTNHKSADVESGGATATTSNKPPPELFYFADVCAGPGGFTEYVLWKKNGASAAVCDTSPATTEHNSQSTQSRWCPYAAHGFGMTLTGKDDFRLQNMLAASPEMFETHYGLPPGRNPGCKGDGDVTNPDNLHHFTDFVRKATHEHGVDLFMADGGFSVEGQENIQEILSKRMYLCQILCAFKILAVGGNLICKLFDVFTPFSAGLLYLMWRCFGKLALHKPNTSRPANSERYVIGMGFRHDCDYVIEHLWQANLEYDKLAKSADDLKVYDLIDLVPMSVLRESPSFCQYLTDSNIRFARRQTYFLHKYKAYARNKMLADPRQSDLRERCLKYWHVPDMSRPNADVRQNPASKLAELCGEDSTALLNDSKPSDILTSASQIAQFVDHNSFFSYNCLPLTTKQPCLIMGLGATNVYYWEGTRWDRQLDFPVHLPKDTLVFGEFSYEYAGEGKNASRTPILRIFDAYYLNGKDVSTVPYRYRYKEVIKFCAAISHEFSRSDLAVARAAEKIDAEHLFKTLMCRLKTVVYRNSEKIALKYSIDSSTLLHVVGLMFYNHVQRPWTLFLSKTTNKPYLFNLQTNESSYEGHAYCYADFKRMHTTRRTLLLPPNARSVEGSGASIGADAVDGSSEAAVNDSSASNNRSPYFESFVAVLRAIDSRNPRSHAATHQNQQHGAPRPSH